MDGNIGNNGKIIMTAEELVRIVVRDLSGIRVPVSMAAEIGMPVAEAVKKLQLCLDAWEKSAAEHARRQAEAAKPAEEEPVVELLEVGEEPAEG